MPLSNVSTLNTSVQKTQVWLQELAESGPFDDEAQAYSALRAVLQALRDRLTVEEAAHLSAQLPIVVRGVYFEGWTPASVPVDDEDRDAFYARVGEALEQVDVDPAHATKSVFTLLGTKITAGELDHIGGMLPEDLQQLWEETTQVTA